MSRKKSDEEITIIKEPVGGYIPQYGQMPDYNSNNKNNKPRSFIKKALISFGVVIIIVLLQLFNIFSKMGNIITISRQKAKQKVNNEFILDDKEGTTIETEQLEKIENSSQGTIVQKKR